MTNGSAPGRADDGRVAASPTEVIDRARKVGFSFEGARVSGFEGDTVASALYASGRRVFSRSFKYHRARGLLCVSGRCPNCMVNVDGVPNQRACTVKVSEGMRVRRQNSWPSLDHDVYSGIERIGRFMPVGFYYKTFINEPLPWHRVKGFIRGITGLGSVEEELAAFDATTAHGRGAEGGHSSYEQLSLTCDVLVIGGGVAGLTAALEASSLGPSVILVDDQPELGGHHRYGNDILRVDPETGEGKYNGLKATELVRDLVAAVNQRKNITVLSDSTAFGVYESNLVGVYQEGKMVRIRADQLVIAAGAEEYPSLFRNNDLPGIFLGRAVQKLVNLYGVAPGRSVVVAASNDSGLQVARSLLEAGITVSAYVDSRKGLAGSPELDLLRRSKAQIFEGHAVKEARGTKRISSAFIVPVDGAGNAQPVELRCDALALDTGFETEAWLLAQAGCTSAFDEELGEFLPEKLKPSVHACGDVRGIHDTNALILQAKVAGLSASLRAMGSNDDQNSAQRDAVLRRIQQYSKALEGVEARYRASVRSRAPAQKTSALPPEEGNKTFVCLCEDVVGKDLAQAVFEGFDDIETLKRYSTATMGPCQGKMCSMNTFSSCAHLTGRSMSQTGRTVSRPPYDPLPMGALAGAELEPVRLTPMHYRHVDLGARLMDMGEWKRPFMYTAVEDEYKAVRERVGIIDVGTLGRLDVKGEDAAKLLDFVYTHIFSNLKVGKSRYGVICDDAGIILDDGTVTRLAENQFFITTTTGNLDFVEQWLGWWAASYGLDAHVTNLTSGLAAVNVAGPEARQVLSKLTSIDLSNASFPYMNAAQGLVAGIPCILLRIGFVGETGWEIHFPAEYGEYLWDAILQAGKEFGIRPFGVETQRVLRLDKKHIIVGQDTDALSNPFESGMDWVVKFEKQDFVGRAALEMARARGDQKRTLLGFAMEDDSLAHDGDSVYSKDGAKLIGFVTSSRRSPTLNKCVGMALLDSNFRETPSVKVLSQGTLRAARIVPDAFYDPEGKRLKS